MIAASLPLKVSRILHAGYLFECQGQRIAFDPIFENPFSRNCYAFPNVQFDSEQIQQLKIDAVFISHYHDDHCSFESLKLLDRQTPIYIFCVFEEMHSWIRELGFKNVRALSLDQTISLEFFEVTPRRALDREVDSIFHIRAAGLNILNVVDSWIDDATLELLVQTAPWDLVLWPFQTMRELEVISPLRAQVAAKELPSEWVSQLKALEPRFVVPSSCQFIHESWSWYNHALFPISYQDFQEQIEKAIPTTKVIRMNPSASIFLDSSSATAGKSLSWMWPLGNQDVDYQYKMDLPPPSTAQVACHFPPVTQEQRQKINEYCQAGLIAKYNSMVEAADDYFAKPRTWQLSVYDHEGKATSFHYRIQDGQMSTTSQTNGKLSWLTELPLFKFCAALENGESLTSMYVRVNDMQFEPAIESEIQYLDALEDPLVRCLFSGAFGEYQKSQLHRILHQSRTKILKK
jgi:hypothetical protein